MWILVYRCLWVINQKPLIGEQTKERKTNNDLQNTTHVTFKIEQHELYYKQSVNKGAQKGEAVPVVTNVTTISVISCMVGMIVGGVSQGTMRKQLE